MSPAKAVAISPPVAPLTGARNRCSPAPGAKVSKASPTCGKGASQQVIYQPAAQTVSGVSCWLIRAGKEQQQGQKWFVCSAGVAEKPRIKNLSTPM